MTYRRLFLWLFTGSALALAAVWWLSLRGTYGALLETAGARYAARMSNSTVALFYNCQFLADTRAEADATGFLDHFKYPPVDPWDADFHVDPSGRSGTGMYEIVGSFRMLRNLENYDLGKEYHVGYGVAFPIWLPWLLVAGGSYGFCRFMERRAAGRTGSIPAPQQSPDGSADNPS